MPALLATLVSLFMGLSIGSLLLAVFFRAA